MTPDRLVNIHAHLHVHDDVPARVRDWERHRCVKTCVLADCRFWQPPHSTYCGNEQVLRWMREFPDVMVGMGSVELGSEMGCPDDISRLRDQGFDGLKFEMPSHRYDHDRYMPLYERARGLSMPILFHTGHVARLESSDARERLSTDSMRPMSLDRIARSVPGLRIIGAHLGMPHADEALQLLSSHPNVYFDICGGGGGKRHLAKLKRALAPFPGADWDDAEENLALEYFGKMVFGTDNPPLGTWLPAAEAVMDYLHIPDETRQRFYWRNAASIFSWEL